MEEKTYRKKQLMERINCFVELRDQSNECGEDQTALHGAWMFVLLGWMDGWLDGQTVLPVTLVEAVATTWPQIETAEVFNLQVYLDHMKLKWTLNWLNLKVLNGSNIDLGPQSLFSFGLKSKGVQLLLSLPTFFPATTAIKQPTNKNYLSCLYLWPNTHTQTHQRAFISLSSFPSSSSFSPSGTSLYF